MKDLQDKLSSIINQKRQLFKDKNSKTTGEYIISVSNLAKDVDEIYHNFQHLKSKDSSFETKIKSELVILFEELATQLQDIKQYQKTIDIDRRILKLDNKHHQSYARLYKNYCEIGQNDNGVIFGQMLKGMDKKIIDKYYKELIDEIDKETKRVAHQFQNESMFKHIKFTKTHYVKFVFFIFSLIFLIHGYWTGKIFK